MDCDVRERPDAARGASTSQHDVEGRRTRGRGMNLSLTEDQELLRDSLAKLLSCESSPERIRAAEPLGFDRELWDALVDMGVPLMRVPEDAGGAGFNLMDAAILVEEAGRHLASAPVVEALVAGRLLRDPNNASAAEEWASRFASGDAVISIALHDVADSPTQIVAAGAVADAVIGLDGDTLVLASGGDHPLLSNIGSYPLARWQFGGNGAVERVILQQGAAARQLYEAAVEEWRLLTAVYLAALGRRALEMAAEYSNERMAFDQPIGSYQGLAHPMADSAMEIDGAIYLARRTIWAIAERRDEAAASIPMSLYCSAKACAQATARALHVFGGYGLSLEYNIQLYFRRCKTLSLLFGDPAEELDCIADRLWAGKTAALPAAGNVTIDFNYGEEAAKFRETTRKFFEDTLDDELRAHAHHSWRGHHPHFHKKLAEAGLLFPDWPEEYGGQGRDRYQMMAMSSVFSEFGWTRNAIAVSDMVGRAILEFGSDVLKDEVLPPLTGGDKLCCLGFSEPSCGSDVFAAKTKAQRDNDDWVINGQKMFTSGAEISDYVLLLTRTDVDVPKHMGLTMFLVPLSSDGVEIQEVQTLADERTNITYYDNVRVPDSYRIGEVNGGITVMAHSLAKEQDGTWYAWEHRKMLERAVGWAKSHPREDDPAINRPEVRRQLAETAIRSTVADVLCRRNLWCAAESVKDRSAGPMCKLFSSEICVEDAARLMNMMGTESVLSGDDAVHPYELDVRLATATTIYAGSSEIMRSLIAENSLKMPRTRS